MAEFVGVKLDTSSISKSFYTARKQIRLGIDRALKASGPKVLNKTKQNAPVLRNRLKTALKFAVEYKAGESSLKIVVNDAKVNKYFMVREDGPEGGIIEGNPNLVFVPKFSPFWSKTATVQSAKEEARSAGYSYFFQPEGSKILWGIRRKRRGRKRTWVKTGAEFAPILVITPIVHQEGKPYIQPAFTEELPNIQERIIQELTKIFTKE